MTDRYPEIEPYDSGLLEVGDGQHIYWESCGNPGGKPALVLHGGPGSGCTPGFRRYFDPTAYRVVLFDQRGSGRSTPHAADYDTDLRTNTTAHLLRDIEQLRSHLGIERWLVWGVSWGATLALAYGEHSPERVTEIVLGAVTMTRPEEIDWLYHGARRFLPEAWARFRAGARSADRDGDLVAAYYRLLNDPEQVVREQAAVEWCAWEDALMSLDHGYQPDPRYDDPRFRLAFARIVTHYFHHGAWLDDGVLLRDAGRLAGIRGALVQGRADLAGPPLTAWELTQAWPDAKLHLVGGGHGGGAEWTSRLVEATDRFADPPAQRRI